MYKYYNAHPKGLTVGDCVKRAITLTTRKDYMEVQRELNRHKKVTGAAAYNTDYNPHNYVETVLHGEKLSFPAVKGKPRMNGRRFCESYPRGRFILNMAGHWSCCIDGIIYDTWDCSEKCVYTAYKITPIDNKNFKYRECCISEPVSETRTKLTIYDDLGEHIVRTVKNTTLRENIRTLEDLGFIHVRI